MYCYYVAHVGCSKMCGLFFGAWKRYRWCGYLNRYGFLLLHFCDYVPKCPSDYSVVRIWWNFVRFLPFCLWRSKKWGISLGRNGWNLGSFHFRAIINIIVQKYGRKKSLFLGANDNSKHRRTFSFALVAIEKIFRLLFSTTWYSLL